MFKYPRYHTVEQYCIENGIKYSTLIRRFKKILFKDILTEHPVEKQQMEDVVNSVILHKINNRS